MPSRPLTESERALLLIALNGYALENHRGALRTAAEGSLHGQFVKQQNEVEALRAVIENAETITIGVE